MQVEDYVVRQAEAAEQFEAHEPGRDGERIAHSLTHGLNSLRNLVFARVHDDVEQLLGADSMIVPVSQAKADAQTKAEIELYQVAEAAAIAHERNYVKLDADGWFSQWLGRLRLGHLMDQPTVRNRLAEYAGETIRQRELRFTNHLVKSLREANRAPLVLYRLYPYSIGIVTAIAFGDHFGATEMRHRQRGILPSIEYCRQCTGRVLDNGERCQECGNPVWNYKWLQTDE